MRLHPGEIEATGWRAESLADVIRRLRDTSPQVEGRPRVIAIDGRGGAGKSTLVERLRAAVPASAVVGTDDIAWHHACFDWGSLLVERVLRPLHRGEAVEFRPQAWIDRGRPGAITVPANREIVWIEGTGIVREELDGWLDASIWVQADLDEQERRLVERDGDSPEQRAHVASWLEEELPFMLKERPWARATLVVAGSTDFEHDAEDQLIVASPTRPFGYGTCTDWK